eukprot:gnl/TRDRNA2_/TRDRNA2_172007_c0_seq6.p1 gnl/TRDRNA2_/TRDRNA2_172007_c0~~gnl/TRDRNA2_/TRDRNA2_172007_c0_seq6.p1  ORF type:complete len:146 (+),score=8.17 gnl/TRDRNA2_/TRDRNA2_172007_c0_seq6:90-527(+)
MPRNSSRSRSPPRGSRRNDSRDRGRGRDRSRSRGNNRGGPRAEDWGNEGTIMQLKSSGFGFIRPNGGQVDDGNGRAGDLYFHAKECSRDTPFADMQVNDLVSYVPSEDDRTGKWMATKVTIVGGGKKKSRKDSRGRSDSRRRSRR